MSATILVADDDRAIRTVLNQALARLGHDVRMTGNAATLWRWIADGDGDLVITDVIMPEMTGPELIRYLKATSPHEFAVLFVTGYVGEGESDDLRDYELLRKPFTVGALAASVAAALARTSEPPRTSAAAVKA
jgi:DNA-binding NtrC family response regulator